MLFQPLYDGNVITDSRRIEIFFRRDGLAQRYLRNIKWMVDAKTKEEYKEHLLVSRRINKRDGYDRCGA